MPKLPGVRSSSRRTRLRKLGYAPRSGTAGLAFALGKLSAGGQRGEPVRHGGEQVGRQAVPGKPADFLGGDGACFAQDAQVVADCGLLRAGRVDEVAGAELLGRQQFDDPQP